MGTFHSQLKSYLFSRFPAVKLLALSPFQIPSFTGGSRLTCSSFITVKSKHISLRYSTSFSSSLQRGQSRTSGTNINEDAFASSSSLLPVLFFSFFCFIFALGNSFYVHICVENILLYTTLQCHTKPASIGFVFLESVVLPGAFCQITVRAEPRTRGPCSGQLQLQLGSRSRSAAVRSARATISRCFTERPHERSF